MIEREFNYINGNTAVQPKRKIERKEKKRSIEDYRKKKIYRERLKRERNLKRVLGVVQTAVLVFALGSITIMKESKIYALKGNIKSLNSEMKLLSEENEAMKVDLLKNSSLKKIEENAKSKAKMIEGKEAKRIEADLSNNYLGDLINNR
ncbi:cell division protein FtsL [uncultured Clostridium sp.]|uniref:cell division protein FtsL n=1 Tax=uncultured Clostridium sp. TaxID=59620 RepID=UPI002622E93C|nr:cell division protein FtsL [uncultured Clostridium sp.]